MDVAKSVMSGELDSQLEAIAKAVKFRQGILKINEIASMKIGDIVVFNNTPRPKYLRGKEAKIVGMSDGKVDVVLVNKVRRYSGTVKCPYSILSKKS
jgi:hypothetical protein